MSFHKDVALANMHGIVCGYGPYASVVARQAQSGLVSGFGPSGDCGKCALQVVSGVTTLWMIVAVSGGTATWLQINTTADSGGGGFSGNFLSVLPGAYQILVSDQGNTLVSGTLTHTDQSGNGHSYTGSANNPTIAGTLNGRATLLFNGTTARYVSSYTAPSPAAGGYDVVAVMRVIAYNTGGRVLSDATDADVLFMASSTALGFYAVSTGPSTTGLTAGTWGLVKGHRVNSSSDSIRAGSAAAVTAAGAGSLGTSATRSIGASAAGNNPSNIEVALVAYGPTGFADGAPFLAALDTYYNSLVLHP